jgi:hypothetical protein
MSNSELPDAIDRQRSCLRFERNEKGARKNLLGRSRVTH